ncbi:unnamed protein product [Bursaphelenchus xylophilus]|uniref:(pine wood nematode) hypothetical protein n=1 Tax=Bursaphelenchus xylophilus TaxID=6326 RepID=A0A1I7SQP7_BURXY|nr:unnamed protein product [Bursaphelenchus xylophilus]CAG9110205.1 unnamed protein product [Bursaphelenchus xylophilus]
MDTRKLWDPDKNYKKKRTERNEGTAEKKREPDLWSLRGPAVLCRTGSGVHLSPNCTPNQVYSATATPRMQTDASRRPPVPLPFTVLPPFSPRVSTEPDRTRPDASRRFFHQIEPNSPPCPLDS